MTPKKPRRWMLSAIAEAAKCTVAMPWHRGPARAKTLERRAVAEAPRALHRRAASRTA